ncbi:four helix bundle protein [Waterburya agarophytonicola K14]|uniref:Four helix bundle protein n=1 Tax=Waterburya agarophytonicola KI4 TaxID=2874699 RepID=A0A964FFR2_9CYAN|nr:four helix bundle protein [Waterburya agarophytonicola KI4]
MTTNKQKSRTFEDLQVWQEAIALAQKIYQITRESEDLSGDRSLVDQLRRASVSISANVSEGFERQRHSKKEYLRFLSIAKGSAGEVRSLLSVAHAVGYVDFKTFWQLREDALSVSKMLGHHMKQVERRIIATEKKNALAVRHRRSRYRSYPHQQAKAS